MSATSETKPRRRWKTISLRGLMLVVVALAVVFARETNLARRQKHAIEVIQRAGGSVGFDDVYAPDGTVRSSSRPAWQRWIMRALGDDYVRRLYFVEVDWSGPEFDLGSPPGFEPAFGPKPKPPALGADFWNSLSNLADVRVLNLREVDATDSGLAAIGGLRRLHSLDLTLNDKITDKGLAHLDHLPELTVIILAYTSISDEGVRHLRGSPRLCVLCLQSTGVGDVTLADIQHWQELEVLSLAYTQISDSGLKHLNRLRKLWSLEVGGTQVSDEGITHLAGLGNIRELGLGETRVTDAGLVHLRELKHLYRLDLSETGITDAGLAHIAGLTSLEWLILSDTPTGDSGILHLARLPRLKALDAGKSVSDKSLPILKSMKGLQHLDLFSTQVSLEGCAELEKAFPKASITRPN